MGSMIICESLSLVVVWTSGVLSQDTSPSSLGDGLSRGHDSRGPLGGPVFRQERGVQRKPLPAFAVLQGPTTQNNHYIRAVS